jgi:hypothetical protein
MQVVLKLGESIDGGCLAAFKEPMSPLTKERGSWVDLI